MNTHTPIWLINCKTPSDSLGKTKSDAPGHNQPSNDGPSRMPAVISPITAGCPNRVNNEPNRRVAKMMAMN